MTDRTTLTPDEWGELVVERYTKQTGTTIDLDILVASAVAEAVAGERAIWRDRVSSALVDIYLDNSDLVVELCDHLDRSGVLLELVWDKSWQSLKEERHVGWD